jgi:hypothetical protein
MKPPPEAIRDVLLTAAFASTLTTAGSYKTLKAKPEMPSAKLMLSNVGMPEMTISTSTVPPLVIAAQLLIVPTEVAVLPDVFVSTATVTLPLAARAEPPRPAKRAIPTIKATPRAPAIPAVSAFVIRSPPVCCIIVISEPKRL